MHMVLLSRVQITLQFTSSFSQKKDGKFRLMVDYTRLNKVTVRQIWPASRQLTIFWLRLPAVFNFWLSLPAVFKLSSFSRFPQH